MSMNKDQVIAQIVALLQQQSPEALQRLYNQLSSKDHIIHLGADRFEHQDMVD